MTILDRSSFLTAAVGSQTPRQWNPRQPLRYPDPDIVVLDKRFTKYKIATRPISDSIPNAVGEGTAWNASAGT